MLFRSDFSVDVPVRGTVKIEGVGFYYNEHTGALSTGNLTLRAFYVIKEGGEQSAHLNLLTHLSYNRALTLMKSGSEASAAISQANEELLATLPIGPASVAQALDPAELSLQTGDTLGNAYLFAVSTVFAFAGGSDAGLQELLNQVAADFAQDGQIGATLKKKLTDAQKVPPYAPQEARGTLLMAGRIEQALADRFAALDSSAVVPKLGRILDQDFDGIPNLSDNCWSIPNPQQNADACATVWTDPDTGLMWTNPTYEFDVTATHVMGNAKEVFEVCQNLEHGGYDDWYLPNIQELKTLMAGCTRIQSCSIVDQCSVCPEIE